MASEPPPFSRLPNKEPKRESAYLRFQVFRG